MKSFSTRIDIQAPADKIWRILLDLPRWPQWNSTVERTVGDIERGAVESRCGAVIVRNAYLFVRRFRLAVP
jgi:hypothetical protein